MDVSCQLSNVTLADDMGDFAPFAFETSLE